MGSYFGDKVQVEGTVFLVFEDSHRVFHHLFLEAGRVAIPRDGDSLLRAHRYTLTAANAFFGILLGLFLEQFNGFCRTVGYAFATADTLFGVELG